MRSETGRTRPDAVRELLLVGSLLLAYKLGRVLISGHVTEAFSAAGRVWHLERWLRLPSEATLQQLVLGDDWLVRSANAYYAWVHFPATAAVLLWAYLRRPDLYRWARTRLAVLTAAGFAEPQLVDMRADMLWGPDVDAAEVMVMGLVGGLLDELDQAARTEAVATLRGSLAAHLGPEGVAYGSACWLVTARRAS